MKTPVLALVLAGLLSAVPATHARVLAFDDFTYANGDLTGRNGGSGFVGP